MNKSTTYNWGGTEVLATTQTEERLSGFKYMDREQYCTNPHTQTYYKGLPNKPTRDEIAPPGLYTPNDDERPSVRDYPLAGLTELSNGQIATLLDESIFDRYNDVLAMVVDHTVMGDTEHSILVSLSNDLGYATRYANGEAGSVVAVDARSGEVMNVGKYLSQNAGRVNEIVAKKTAGLSDSETEVYKRRVRYLVDREDEYLFWGPVSPERYLIDTDPNRALRVAEEWYRLFVEKQPDKKTTRTIAALFTSWKQPRADRVIATLRGWDFYNQEFQAAAGVWEGYTVGQHIAAGLGIFERYFQKRHIEWPVSDAEFKAIVALHDSGKPTAQQTAGEAWRNYEHGYRMYSLNMLARTGAIRPEVSVLAQALTCQDDIGDFIRERVGERVFINRVADRARELSLHPGVYFSMSRALYMCDAGAYTTFGAGVEALDYLFEVTDRTLNFSSSVRNTMDELQGHFESM